MLIKLLHLVESLTGALLGCLGLGLQVGNVVICVLMILLGPAFIISSFIQ